MPRDSGSIGTPQEWLRRAKSNLARAKQPKPEEALWEDLCFDAQQAAEKAVKAVLVFYQIDFPKSHDITELLVILDQSGHEPLKEIWEAGRLSNYAVQTRYPGVAQPVTEEEYYQAVALAEQVVRWAEDMLSTSQE